MTPPVLTGFTESGGNDSPTTSTSVTAVRSGVTSTVAFSSTVSTIGETVKPSSIGLTSTCTV